MQHEMNAVATLHSSSNSLHCLTEASPLKRIKLEHGKNGSRLGLNAADFACSVDNTSNSRSSLKGEAEKALHKAQASDSSSSSSTQQVTESSNGEDLPLKSTTLTHLRQKYLGELEYMLREFQKLERQLLGARSAQTETEASRERREKLHSFIAHLQETITQITSDTLKVDCDGSALTKATPEKVQEESVQKLEEHILANLLPVKNRLKKQLAAQQGASQNPAGMPTRRGYVPSQKEKGTFVAAAEQRKKQTDELRSQAKPDETQFGRPLNGEGSSLTQKLHGSTLGASYRKSEAPSGERKQYKAGMAIGSDQIESSVAAASSVHKFVIQDPDLMEEFKAKPPPPATEEVESQVPIISEEEPKRLRRKKRKKRQARQQFEMPRGPRTVEYMCAHCNEVYNSTCDYNPWWALAQHECPKCHKMQIPRLDISSPANAIDYHPALLAHAEDGGNPGNAGVMSVPPSHLKSDGADIESAGSDLSDDDLEGVSDEGDGDFEDFDESDTNLLEQMSPAEQAENERFGFEYSGPEMEDTDSARLLTLMAHASTCPCQHKNANHKDVCRSTKWMMLHVRDCPGTTSTFDVCPFPWCRKVKHFLYHLVSCTHPNICPICSPKYLTSNMSLLRGLNEHRLKKYREKLIAYMKAKHRPRESPAKMPVASNAQRKAAQGLSQEYKPAVPVVPRTSGLLSPTTSMLPALRPSSPSSSAVQINESAPTTSVPPRSAVATQSLPAVESVSNAAPSSRAGLNNMGRPDHMATDDVEGSDRNPEHNSLCNVEKGASITSSSNSLCSKTLLEDKLCDVLEDNTSMIKDMTSKA